MTSGKEQAGGRAVVLLSGGMDSCVCAALAARDFEAAALHVSYGQRTEERERHAFDGICDRLGIRQRLVVRRETPRLGDRLAGNPISAVFRSVVSASRPLSSAGPHRHHRQRVADKARSRFL